MIYNSKNKSEALNAETRFKYLLSKEKKFELKEVKEIRSLSQNNYIYLLFSYFGLQIGLKTDEVKEDIFKKLVNPDFFYDCEKETDFGSITRWRSTAELNTKEMTDCIERFLNWSAQEAGIRLPEPSDLVYIQEIKNEVDKNKKYL